MKNFLKITSIVFLGFAGSISAQQTVVKKDTLSGTELVVSMDSRVKSAMESLEEKCNRNVGGSTRNYSSDDDDKATPTRPARVLVPSRELTKEEVCRKNPRLMGFKILLTTVKSNDEANEVRSYFRNRFPSLKVEVDASLRPNYKILAGSYFNKQSAASDLSKIREYFKSASAVPYRIFCVEAK